MDIHNSSGNKKKGVRFYKKIAPHGYPLLSSSTDRISREICCRKTDFFCEDPSKTIDPYMENEKGKVFKMVLEEIFTKRPSKSCRRPLKRRG